MVSAVVVAVLAVSACGGDDAASESESTDPPATTTIAVPASDLDAARERWESAGFTDYSFDFRERCFCPEIEWRITVADGEIVASEPLVDGAQEPFGGLPTIDDLFDRIAEEQVDAYKADATYDTDLGYPLSFDVDFVKNAVDDEYSWTVTNLAVA